MSEIPRNWVTGVEPTTPVRDAAEAIVGARLAPVPGLVERVRTDGPPSVRLVHQLRIATRRADAALRAFRPCFKKGRWKRVRRGLRSIRRSASDTRALDVHLQMLGTMLERAPDEDHRALRHAIRQAKRDRAVTQQLITVMARERTPKSFRRDTKRLLAKATQPDEAHQTFEDLAHDQLPHHLHTLAAAVHESLDWAGLHALRIAGKKVRYSMELFAPCYEPELLREQYAMLSEMQSRLGSLNDVHELSVRLERYATEVDQDDTPPGTMRRLLGLAEREALHRTTLRDDFMRWWGETALARRIEDMEQRVAGEPGESPSAEPPPAV